MLLKFLWLFNVFFLEKFIYVLTLVSVLLLLLIVVSLFPVRLEGSSVQLVHDIYASALLLKQQSV